MRSITPLNLICGFSIGLLSCLLFSISCERPVSSGGPSSGVDTTSNVEIQGSYYGIITTDYYTLGRRTTSRVHVDITHTSEERNGCTCAYNIHVFDSVATIAYLCVSGKSSRLTSDCTDTMYHDVFVGTGDGSSATGYIERYKMLGTGSESHYSSMSFDVEKP